MAAGDLTPLQHDRAVTTIMGAIVENIDELDVTDGPFVVAERILAALQITAIGESPGVCYIGAIVPR